MSGAVGSIPSLTRRGRPCASCRSSSPAGRASTALRSRYSACSEGVAKAAQCYARPSDGPPAAAPPDRRTYPSVSMEPRVPDLTYTEPESPKRGTGAIEDLFAPPGNPGPSPEVRKRKPKLKKLRLLLVFTGIGALALVSTIFGLMMSVSSDLPSLENHAQLRIARNSVLFSGSGKAVELAKLT